MNTPRPRDLLVPSSTPIHPFDQIHGTDTSGLVPAAHLLTGHPNDEHVTAYYAVAPSILRGLIEFWKKTQPPRLLEEYTFLDIGCGKGRAILLASEYRFREVIGVELNPTLAEIARKNISLWKRAHRDDPTAPEIAPLRVTCDDALSIDLPAGPTVCFMFHPFEEPVVSALLKRIEVGFAHRPGEVDILYVNAEHAPTLDRYEGFQQLWQGHLLMTPEDHQADIEAIAQQPQYGSTGDELCAIYRFV